MPEQPAVDEFSRRIEALRGHRVFTRHIRKGTVYFSELTRPEVRMLLREPVARYFLLAAAGMTRTTLKAALGSPEAQIVSKGERSAYAVARRLPTRRAFTDIAAQAVALRRGDLLRQSKGAIEALFRERLEAEGIPILMSPPVRSVPGLLVGQRKPDGIYPDPDQDRRPEIYLEIKNVRRVSDDIQKRLYEIAEASLEMKLLYGGLSLTGLTVTPRTVKEAPAPLRETLRTQILQAKPTVVAVLLCSRLEAQKYRPGAETFVDRVFFQEEIDACLHFLRTQLADADMV